MKRRYSVLPALVILSLIPLAAFGAEESVQKSVVAYPWKFVKGTETARETALKTVAEISSKNGYSVIERDNATKTYDALKFALTPTRSQLAKFGKKVGANYVVYGSTTWHTRSIWVGAGPKTISTATVDVNVLDSTSGKVVYSRRGVSGRSDEKENAAKVAAAVLISPLVTAVSGGPQTPQEQRACQIALARAFADWNKQIGK